MKHEYAPIEAIGVEHTLQPAHSGTNAAHVLTSNVDWGAACSLHGYADPVATVPSRITHTDKFPAQSNRGKIRTIVCSEDHIERGGVGAMAKYYVPSGLKTYTFGNGEPAAKIGDAFLDRSGEIYRRMAQKESLDEK